MTDANRQFDALLDYLKRTRGFDFNAYKRTSQMRRVEKRMATVDVTSFVEYMDYLEVHPEEFAQLFNMLLINVTSFFRDEQAWDFIRDDTVPSLVASGDQIRVWSAGCASGEETYSIAMLLREALGPDNFRERVKIYATDVDEEALVTARAALYSDKDVQAVPEPLRQKYFAREGDRFMFDKEMRRSVIFGRHDLIQDAPISRVNLLICRNSLMYFNIEAQSRILARFHFALTPGGILFLGKAEMLLTPSQTFAPVDLRCRIFRKLQKDSWRDRMALMNYATAEDGYGAAANHTQLYSAALDASPIAQIAVDNAGILVVYNERARLLFGLVPTDIGRPFQDLEISYRPVELRSLIEQAYDQRRPVSLNEAPWDGLAPRYFDVQVSPLFDTNSRAIGVTLTFTDVTRTHDLQVQLTRSKQDLETAYEELQSTNEELETTNEELQSTVEELETTNEELQSTNEELETMNEELQSTNEELQTINEELRQRSEDLNRSNTFLESILTGVSAGVIVIDRDMRVLAWNQKSENLWGLRSDEVKGKNVFELDIGLPLDRLRAEIRKCVSGTDGAGSVQLNATNRRGRTISCRVVCTPFVDHGQGIGGAIVMVEEEGARAEV